MLFRSWGECLVGALTQEDFLAQLERAGFYGLEVLKRSYWKDVEGYPFFSVTVRGFKLEKTAGFGLEMRDDPLLRPDEFKLVVKSAGRDVTQQYAVA